MTDENLYEGVGHVVQIDTNRCPTCEYCGKPKVEHDDIAPLVNHYIEKHGYKILHIGQRAYTFEDNKQASHTIAIVGK